MAQREEAVENAAQFVRHGFVELVQEKGRINKETAMILSVKGKEEVGLKVSPHLKTLRQFAVAHPLSSSLCSTSLYLSLY